MTSTEPIDEGGLSQVDEIGTATQDTLSWALVGI